MSQKTAVLRVKKKTAVVTTFKRVNGEVVGVDHVFAGFFKGYKARRYMKQNNMDWIIL